ncbi:hypothetical protein [Pseudoalteromonas sp. Z9A5]|uniref:hypothetical protein n=1 Tax=Pseudoalteromonas sp. Z9A5 TaxID=2686355 RepID=UPI00140DE3C1|nr:hypothetical protein [Pseudoalteromonas sp. Z9A5]
MTDNIENFDAAHNKKLKSLSKEERAKAGLKKLVLELDKNEIPEPKGLVSGKTDKSGKMIVDFEEDYGDE